MRVGILPTDKERVTEIATRLHLSNRETETLAALVSLPQHIRNNLDETLFRRALYEYGREACRDAALLVAADTPTLDITPALTLARAWVIPVFPLQGSDILGLGMPAGPQVGNVLNAVKEWWITKGFHATHAECLAKAKELV